jgi:Domain of Unknown Function (DUF748)
VEALADPVTVPARRHTLGWKRGVLVAVLALAAVFLVVRLLAPVLVRNAIDRRLSQIPSYSGKVDSVDLKIWRGAYRINGMSIVKSNGQVSEPFFTAERIDFSIAWRELFNGRLVSRIHVKNGKLNFLRGSSDENSQLAADKRWQDVINDLFPIDITFLDIEGGELRYIDTTQTPRVDISIKELKVHATGLQNRPAENGDPLPAKIDVSGVTVGNGEIKLYAKLEPLANQTHFELALELKKVSLPALNDILRAYVNVDVSQGEFEMFAQMAMREGHYEGYVKPFVRNLKFADLSDKDKSLGQRIWKDAVAFFAKLATNKNSEQVATRIPFSGEANAMDIHIWKTIENGLHHGFIRALSQGFEGTTHPDGGATKASEPAEKPLSPKP